MLTGSPVRERLLAASTGVLPACAGCDRSKGICEWGRRDLGANFGAEQGSGCLLSPEPNREAGRRWGFSLQGELSPAVPPALVGVCSL